MTAWNLRCKKNKKTTTFNLQTPCVFKACGSSLGSCRGKWAEKEPNWIQVVSWLTWESILFNQIRNNPRKVAVISIVLPIILSDLPVVWLASLLGSTSALHHHIINVRTVEYLQSAVLLGEGSERCAHTAWMKTLSSWKLEVGLCSREGGKDYICKWWHIALMRTRLLCLDYCSAAQKRSKLPSIIIKTYLRLFNYRSNGMQIKSRLAWIWLWIQLKCYW